MRHSNEGNWSVAPMSLLLTRKRSNTPEYDDNELFFYSENDWLTKDVKPYFHLGALSEVCIILKLWHANSMIWTCVTPEFWRYWIKLWNSDNNEHLLMSIFVLQTEGTFIQSQPFLANVPILYPLKTPENQSVFWCFQGV